MISYQLGVAVKQVKVQRQAVSMLVLCAMHMLNFANQAVYLIL